MSTIRIHTTQNVVLEYEAASVGDRVVAQLLDLLVMGLWALVIGFLIEQLTNSSNEQRIISYVLVSAPLLVYHPICEAFFNGQSLGKHLRHLKVARLDGTRPGLGDYLLRWLIGLVEIGLTVGSLALVATLLNGRASAWGYGRRYYRGEPAPAHARCAGHYGRNSGTARVPAGVPAGRSAL
ncbi:RDD family protein [Hymenobacter sp. 5516J-16]|uniref:RDD family protein n=1 Tax=Hymenobacter sp. 5516J-16 TaxID=2932253 RepID=UPI001FD4BB2B|nr:RDD family protein [Hymenobacter sp. 5516J-16]UOQ78096.1 RDD family protein [Hymenobacter sp. 5516J-16]